MKTWAKVLIGVQTAFIIFLLTLNYFRASEAVKYRAQYEVAKYEAEKKFQEADRQARIAVENAARADNEAENAREQATLAQELSIELEKCKSKK